MSKFGSNLELSSFSLSFGRIHHESSRMFDIEMEVYVWVIGRENPFIG